MSRRSSSSSAAAAAAAGTSSSSSLKEALGFGALGTEVRGWRQLERIPSPASASAQQVCEPSPRHLMGIAEDMVALHSLGSAVLPRYDSRALLRLRRRGASTSTPEAVCDPRLLFTELGRWLLADAPSSTPLLKITPRRATDPKPVAAVAALTHGHGASKTVVPRVRRQRIAEAAGSKAMWQHQPTWTGTLSVQHRYALRLQYPSVQLFNSAPVSARAPRLSIRQARLLPMTVDSDIRVILSAGSLTPHANQL